MVPLKAEHYVKICYLRVESRVHIPLTGILSWLEDKHK